MPTSTPIDVLAPADTPPQSVEVEILNQTMVGQDGPAEPLERAEVSTTNETTPRQPGRNTSGGVRRNTSDVATTTTIPSTTQARLLGTSGDRWLDPPDDGSRAETPQINQIGGSSISGVLDGPSSGEQTEDLEI